MSNARARVLAAMPPEADLLVRSPGRINLIGEHTDYNGGLVMPAAIDKAIYFGVRRTAERAWRLTALDLGETATLHLPVSGPVDQLWVNYLAGVGEQFQQLGHELPGLEITFGGDLPRGSGMSSSAALEGGMAFTLNELLGAGLSRPELAQLCKRSSNSFLGVPSGIMDQFASLNGSASGPLRLNCETLAFKTVNSRTTGYEWLLVNSMVTHELGSSEYPERVRECAAALAAIQNNYPYVSELCNATQEQLLSIRDAVPENVYRRADYVINENLRVHAMTEALEAGNVRDAGHLLNQTHAGLRDDYAVSCAEVDFLQEQATVHFPGDVAGARIMGGGFGGCTINLVRSQDVAKLEDFLTEAYLQRFGRTPEFYPVRLAAGTSLEL